jgi:hypothetical protein
MMRLFDLIKIWEPGFEPELAKIHLARHNNIEHPIDVYIRGEFEEWQRWQKDAHFNRPYVVSLVQARQPTLWLFVGLYRPTGSTWVEARGDEEAHHWYDLERLSSAAEWAGRLFLRSQYTARHSRPTGELLADDLTVTELLPERLSIGQFPGYKQVDIGLAELDILVRNNTESWRAALAAVKGIYLITDTTTGKLYVGKADGTDGIWGRWSTYARTGHGHNVGLKKEFGIEAPPERKNDLRFSILEIADLGATDIDERETHWKRILISRDFGYNRN